MKTDLIRCTFILGIVLFSLKSKAQNPSFKWANKIGYSQPDIAASITTDKAENVYSTGLFAALTDFDPGADTFLIYSIGYWDVYVQKLDKLGNFEWAISFGGNGTEGSSDCIVDQDKNVYIIGTFSDTVDFDPGSGKFDMVSNSIYDGYILKLDSNGVFVWAKQLKGNTRCNPQALEFDKEGNLYLTGTFEGTVDFDTDTGTTNYTTYGSADIFIQKLSPLGNTVWTKQIGGPIRDFSYHIVVDSSKNSYITGKFANTVDFDPSSNTNFLHSRKINSNDAFVLKIDSAGTFVWVKQLAGTSNVEGTSLGLFSNKLSIAGDFIDTLDLDPGSGIVSHVSNGDRDVYLLDLDLNGNYLWGTSFGGPGQDTPGEISVDYLGNLFVGGSFEDSVDFNPYPGVSEKKSNGYLDAFLLKFDGQRSFKWVSHFGGPLWDETKSIAVDNKGGLLMSGEFNLTVDFNPGSGIFNMGSKGLDDIYNLKLSECGNPTKSDVVSACVSYTWIDGNTYTSSNFSATHIIPASFGCDTIVSLFLNLTTIDTIVYQNGTTLFSNATASSFQWLDCNNNYSPIQGANSYLFNSSSNGSYALQIIKNGCIDTTNCVNIIGVGLEENEGFDSISLFPNPGSNRFTISLNELSEKVEIRISNIKGQLVFTKEFQNHKNLELIPNLSDGIYLLEIKTEKGSKHLKLAINK